MTDLSDIKNITADINLQTVHSKIAVESATDDVSGPETTGLTVRNDMSIGRRIESEYSKRGLSLRVGASTDSIVAFNAYLSHTILEPGDEYSIKYDRVVTNVGDGYNHVTGAFTCPKAGVYIFTWCTAMANPGRIITNLMKNGGSVAYSFIAYEVNYPAIGSQTSVLVLNVGDFITVKVIAHGPHPALYATYTTFTGFLLH